MSDTPSLPAPCPSRPGHHPLWLLALAALLGWQGWMTLGLFGPGTPEECWRRMLDGEPVQSGRHPLHLYHGYLGARALSERGQMCCFDPAFHAGYPKTPVFDPGSRPAEVMLLLVGAEYRPAAYKVGLAVVVFLVPLWVYLGARGLGLERAVAVVAGLLGQAVWWGRPGREALLAGDVDLVLGALMLLVQAGLLVRYHKRPGLCLVGVVVTGGLGWFAHPLLTLLLLPAFLVYYLSAGTRHRLAWHAPLLVGLAVAIGANAFWLFDWVSFWWVRVPPGLDTPVLESPGLRALWDVPLWGCEADKSASCALMGAGVVGLVVLNQTGQRPAARLVGLCALGLGGLVLAGTMWEPLCRLGVCQLLLPALWFACVPAGLAVVRGLGLARRWGGLASPAALCAAVPLLLWLAAPGRALEWVGQFTEARPLSLGLDEEQRAVVRLVQERTDGSARVLWEDRACDRKGSRWSALLPVLTGRSFIGGLDAEAGIEHATCGLIDGQLAGRPLGDWTDAELADYCRRYNVGWVVCWSEPARARFGRWKLAGGGPTAGGGPGLYTVSRARSFALEGTATWCSAGPEGVLLADVAPRMAAGEEEGEVVLSLHYQAGMRVRPDRLRIEPAFDPRSAVPFVRLRMRQPVGRVFITWEGR